MSHSWKGGEQGREARPSSSGAPAGQHKATLPPWVWKRGRGHISCTPEVTTSQPVLAPWEEVGWRALRPLLMPTGRNGDWYLWQSFRKGLEVTHYTAFIK